ncbi:probable LRR receptor-like serine/threonine-protein kinase at N-terminal half [Coccomyxa sp. Obi]|nr:probable LRR receptor-like serine/threonine-protein kinase at N-terminal half [Coccomyxa sp. Obi]
MAWEAVPCLSRRRTELRATLCIAIVLVSVASVFAQPGNPLGGTAETDGSALQKLPAAFGNPPTLASWQGSNPCTGTWVGIGCSLVNGAQRVTSLNLNGMGLNGTLPDSLIQLTTLQIMNLSSNAIGGSLPTNWGWNNVFTQLQVITLDDNNLSGSLPSSYSNPNAFKSLIVLNMDRNNLSGSLPASWGSPGALPALRVLAAKSNSLDGPLPAAWGNSSTALPSLTILSLDANKLSGALPPSWSAGWPSLSLLTLTDNSLGGNLPTEWGGAKAFPKLTIMALNGNNFSGSFPESWAANTAFASMRNSGNGIVLQPGNELLSGSVPLGTPYPVLRYEGGTSYTMCSAFPCRPLAPALGPGMLAMAPAPMVLMPSASGGLPAPATAPTPGPAAAAVGGQTIVATLDLVGQGLNPLSSKDSDALLGVISKIIAPHNATVSSVRLGQVQDLVAAAPSPGIQVHNVRRRQLLTTGRYLAEGGPGSQAQVLISTQPGASNSDVQSIVGTLATAASSGQLLYDLKAAGIPVDQVSLGAPAFQPAGQPVTVAGAAAPAPPAASSGAGIGLGAIIGIVVGAVVALLIAALVAFFVARRRRAREDRKSLKPSPSVPAVPPPTSPQSPALTRGRSAEAGTKSPRVAGSSVTASAAPDTPKAGKTNVIPYSQYRKSRLDSIRNDLGLSGAGSARPDAAGAQSSQITPRGSGQMSPLITPRTGHSA